MSIDSRKVNRFRKMRRTPIALGGKSEEAAQVLRRIALRHDSPATSFSRSKEGCGICFGYRRQGAMRRGKVLKERMNSLALAYQCCVREAFFLTVERRVLTYIALEGRWCHRRLPESSDEPQPISHMSHEQPPSTFTVAKGVWVGERPGQPRLAKLPRDLALIQQVAISKVKMLRRESQLPHN